MKLVDSHCHLHDPAFFSEKQQKEMLERAKTAGVSRIICIGTDPSDSLVARDFANQYDGVFWTYGIHPEETKRQAKKPDLDDKKLVAIGEVGLDYHREGYDREGQIRLFEEMLDLAKKYNLPVSFHVREAFEDFFGVIANFPEVKGVVHSFTDNKKVLKKILNETDFFVGVNGIATYSTLPLPPLSRILLETDAPFLTPTPFRGIINEPAYILNIAEWLAERIGADLETVSKETTENVEKLFMSKTCQAEALLLK